ncbi:MAG: hypothetical protein JO020_23345 [Chloroflexi bacterium]|nr:hypothetical protein [Chloroflexota bacterium]MBV9897112.1 hypothetical protein [Chloroflexota bacterium]
MNSTFPRFESPGQLALVAVVIWLIGALFHPLAVLAPIGVVLLVVAGVAYVLRPKNQSMYWRGRRIDLDQGHGAGAQLYHALFKR